MSLGNLLLLVPTINRGCPNTPGARYRGRGKGAGLNAVRATYRVAPTTTAKVDIFMPEADALLAIPAAPVDGLSKDPIATVSRP